MGDRLDEQPPPSSNNRSSSSSGANSPSPLQSPTPAATPMPLHHGAAAQAQQQQSTFSSAAIVNMNMAMLTQPHTNNANNGQRNRNANVDQGLSRSSFTSEDVRLTNIAGPPSQYVKLNVGGYLHYTTIATLTKHDSMLRAMFSGRMEVLTDAEGWVLIDRCGKHFTVILNFLRDGAVALPESRREILEILSEARYYCIQSLIDLCQAWIDLSQKNEDSLPVCRIPIITSSKEEKSLLQSTSRPAIKLLLNRHNNKYSYTSQSDDNLLKNLELFDKLIMRFHERVLFIKDVGAANEVCSWTFYGHGQKVTEVCCTSIVYATDKKHTKVEFPEARIYEEAMNILLYEPDTLCPSCLSLNWQQCSGSGCSSQQQQPPATQHRHQQRVIAASVADESQLSPGADHNENTNVGGAVVAAAAAPSTSSGYCSDYEYRRLQQQRAKQAASRAAEI